ncbi:MAG TPA: hypothetical protein VLG50_05505 [Candidatus Saccharimonadales bacterium]|nr:hypothetical protein [Candidatus Saccharimonadales bacterium]
MYGATGPIGATGPRGSTDNKSSKNIILFKIYQNCNFDIECYKCYNVPLKNIFTYIYEPDIKYNNAVKNQVTQNLTKMKIEYDESWFYGWFEFFKFIKDDCVSTDIFRHHILCYYVPLRIAFNLYTM